MIRLLSMTMMLAMPLTLGACTTYDTYDETPYESRTAGKGEVVKHGEKKIKRVYRADRTRNQSMDKTFSDRMRK